MMKFLMIAIWIVMGTAFAAMTGVSTYMFIATYEDQRG